MKNNVANDTYLRLRSKKPSKLKKESKEVSNKAQTYG